MEDTRLHFYRINTKIKCKGLTLKINENQKLVIRDSRIKDRTEID